MTATSPPVVLSASRSAGPSSKPRSANLQKSAVAQAARLMNVSERSVYMAKELGATGRADLEKACERGEISLLGALKIAKPEKYAKSTAPAQVRAAWARLTSDERMAFLDWIIARHEGPA